MVHNSVHRGEGRGCGGIGWTGTISHGVLSEDQQTVGWGRVQVWVTGCTNGGQGTVRREVVLVLVSSFLINMQLKTGRQREERGGRRAGQSQERRRGGGRGWRMRRAGGGSCWIQQRALRGRLQDRQADKKRTDRT